MFIAIAMSLVLNLVSSGSSLVLVTAMVTNLQLATHLPIMNFIFPQNAMIYLKNMKPVMMFDFLDEMDWYTQAFKSEWYGYNLKDQLIDLGYDSHNPYLLLGTYSFLMAVYLLRVLVLFTVLLPLAYWRCKGK